LNSCGKGGISEELMVTLFVIGHTFVSEEGTLNIDFVRFYFHILIVKKSFFFGNQPKKRSLGIITGCEEIDKFESRLLLIY
jgi:hypothetical protein